MITLINIKSIYSNIELLIDYIIEFKPLFVTLTETWLSTIDNGNIINQQLLPLRYKCIHIIRKTGCRGGGVGIIYRDTINLINSHDLYLTNCECIKADFIINKLYIFNIIVIYRPPSNNYITFINEFYELTSSICLDFTLVMGDFNFHFNKSDRSITELKKMFLTNNWIQHVQTHTHVLGNILDLVITSRFFKYNINKLPIKNVLTDHYVVPILIDVSIYATIT